MRRVTIILDILSRRRIGESVFVFLPHLLDDSGHDVSVDCYTVAFAFGAGSGFFEGGEDGGAGDGAVFLCGEGDERGGGLHRHHRVRVAAEHALDGCGRVETGRYAAA